VERDSAIRPHVAGRSDSPVSFKSRAAGKCEKLGAAHLLLHGIWAFKVSATGERTDLVLGEKLEITPQVEAASEALVLTEWKCVRKPGELDHKINEAFSQAKIYSVGVLADFELASRRYH
jgi:hypothetical protein